MAGGTTEDLGQVVPLLHRIVGHRRACYNNYYCAGVMELAVMRDSKSRAVTPRAGSTPASGTT